MQRPFGVLTAATEPPALTTQLQSSGCPHPGPGSKPPAVPVNAGTSPGVPPPCLHPGAAHALPPTVIPLWHRAEWCPQPYGQPPAAQILRCIWSHSTQGHTQGKHQGQGELVYPPPCQEEQPSALRRRPDALGFKLPHPTPKSVIKIIPSLMCPSSGGASDPANPHQGGRCRWPRFTVTARGGLLSGFRGLGAREGQAHLSPATPAGLWATPGRPGSSL